MLDLSGIWLGTYWQLETPTRFELSLIQTGNSLVGNILDDNHLGEANLSGEIIGKRITFTKCYLLYSTYHIYYTGTISDKGDYMSGQWRINRDSGAWEAYRSEDLLMLESEGLKVATISRK